MEQSESLAARVRSGYLHALASRPNEVLRGLEKEATAEEAVRQVRSRLVPLQTRDRIVEAVVRAYRIGQRQLWGPVLLEMLGPQLTEAVQQFGILAPLVDGDDLGQQLVLEVLSAAATVPIPEGARWVEQRLLRRAGFNLARWLFKQSRLIRSAVDPDSPLVSQQAYRIYLEQQRIEEAIESLEGPYPDRRNRRRRLRPAARRGR
ncbi:MAG TPA: hypothetical protein VMU89_03850 [Thermomicrobiaceae bacterium]|nr:hypothetical protein [Thermomicrobiaceae bacterium]